MAKILFDLDDTLLHTARFKEDYFNALGDIYNVPAVVFMAEYAIFKKRNGNFDHLPFLVHVQSVLSVPPSTAAEELLEHMSWERYIDAETIAVLTKLQDEHELYLVTKGVPELQSAKINEAGLTVFFSEERIVIWEGSKAEVLRRHFSDTVAYFVNDKEEETRAVVQHCTKLTPIIFNKFSGKASAADWVTISDLRALVDLIKK